MTSDAQFEVAQFEVAQFEVTVPERSGLSVLKVRGEIDVASAPDFGSSLSDFIGSGPELVIVDMSEATFIDSTGLGVLISAEKQIRHAGKDLRLVVTHPQITKLLELTGLDQVFTVLSSTNDAVRT
jgi:anti-sigma B factor antagonist